MLAVIRKLGTQKHLLEDVKFKLEVWTNYKNLEYFIKVQNLNWRQARQILYLSRFDFTLNHMPGVRIGKADSLSRKLDLKMGAENNNENLKSIKEEQIKGMMEVVVEGPEMKLVENIKRAREKDEKVVKVVE